APHPPARPGRRLPRRHPRPDHVRPCARGDPRPLLRGPGGRQGARARGAGPPRHRQARALAAERDRCRCGRVGPGTGAGARRDGAGRSGLGVTSPTPQLAELRTRPTAALVRAAVIGGASLALALLLGRPEIILAGLPLMVSALVALARRIRRGEERTVVDPTQRVSRRSIEEGGTVAVTVRTAPGVLTAATLPMPRHARVAPRHGSLAGDGAVALRVSAQR